MDWAKGVTCKNISIYGFCKYADQGCAFNHELPKPIVKEQQPVGNKVVTLKTPDGTITSLGSLAESITKSSTDLGLANSNSANEEGTNSIKFNPESRTFTPISKSTFRALSSNISDIPSFTPSVSPSISNAQIQSNSDGHISDIGSLSINNGDRTEISQQPINASCGLSTASPAFKPMKIDAPMFKPGSANFQPSSIIQQQISAPSISMKQVPMVPGASLATQTPTEQQIPLQSSHDLSLISSSQQLPQQHHMAVSAPQAPPPLQDPMNAYRAMSYQLQFPEMYFSPSNFSLNHHLYAPQELDLSHILDSNEESVGTLFIPNDLRESLLKNNVATLQTMQHSNLPDHVAGYHSLVPLDRTLSKSMKNYTVPSSLYKVFSIKDGCAYAMRRLEGFNLTNEKSLSVIRRWKKVSMGNANIITVHEAFTNYAFDDNSLFTIHSYQPNAKSLKEIHMHKPKSVPEPLLWNYISQITIAMLSAHEANLPFRLLTSDKIVTTNKNQIMVSGAGIIDLINFDIDFKIGKDLKCDDKGEYVDLLKKFDLKQFGYLILELIYFSTGKNFSLDNIDVFQLYSKLDKEKENIEKEFVTKALENVLFYSNDIKQAVAYLFNMEFGHTSSTFDSNLLPSKEESSIQGFSRIIAPKMARCYNELASLNQFYEKNLANAIENDRLFRLITKINFILERSEYSGDLSWSETGERYPVKLFRDYVFHQVDDQGKPVLDLVHVLGCLNKLDAAIDEKIMLVSRDESSCIIASYKEIKECIEFSFHQLMK